MITTIVTHALLALLVCVITLKLLRRRYFGAKLGIHRVVKVTLDSRIAEDHPRKKKGKKIKRKGRRAQYIEVLNYDEEQEQFEQHGDGDSEKGDQVGEREEIRKEIDDINEDNIVKQSKITMNQQSIQSKTLFLVTKTEEEQQTERIFSESKEKVDKQVDLQKINHERRLKVSEEIELLRNYFIQELEEIVPYNGHYGHYKLSIEGTKKSLSFQWKYTEKYPLELIDLHISREVLYPVELQTLDSIMEEHRKANFQTLNYPYIFNVTTAIYQDLMLFINYGQEEQKSVQEIALAEPSKDSQEFDLYKPHNNPEDIKMKKEIYGKILDQIFYLHDLIEKPDFSSMKIQQNEETAKIKQLNARGRYEAEFEELQMIGEGGFGKVYKVRHKLDHNIYAIKKAVVNCQDYKDRIIIKQVSLLSKLNHPNIVRYYQSWLEDANSIQQIISDMSFSENENEKIEELNHIYREWKDNKSGIRFGGVNSENSYSGSQVENSGIVFANSDDEDSGIVFQDDGEDMQVSEGSSIKYASNSKNESQQSMMQGLKGGFPFKILYIAMQLCSGINLREFINHRFNQQEHKIQILRGILEALAYIHSKRIIHRDLKPANIFLTENNKVKIGDFGLATTEEKSMNFSLSAEFNDIFNEKEKEKTKAVGTGFYRAPEQLNSSKYDEKTDIYSLGIIIFELFYPFQTAMERFDVLKRLTQTRKLPKDFVGEHGTDIIENINACLQQIPEKRPSASKLLQSFRNKYFTQLVSCIANPKHFQFSQLLSHLFAIKNEAGSPLMWRDLYKNYVTSKIMKIYQIHRATHFPTLSLIPVQDFNILNGHKIKASRNGKYLLLTERGIILEYSSNCLKSWLKYAKDAIRRKKSQSLDQQREAIRRFTFEKIVNINTTQPKEDLQFHQKMVTAYDITYKLDEGFNAFYLCEALKVSEAIVLTLNLTQKKPPIFLSHSLLFRLIAIKFNIPTETLYTALLSITDDAFSCLSLTKRISYFEQKLIPSNHAKKICQYMQGMFDSGLELLQSMQLKRQCEIYKQVEYEILEFEKIRKRVVDNPVRWKLELPPSNCNGFYWQVGIVKGLTSVEDYLNGQELCNYHIETYLDQDPEEADVSLWCIGQYLEEQMQRFILECWKNGLATKWYEWQVGEKEDMQCRHNIILRRKNDRVQVMVRHNEARKGEHRQERQSSFISLEQFSWDVVKQMAILANPKFYH